MADYEDCPLKPVYSKAKGTIIRPSGAEVSQIRGQQKVLRTRLIRDNRLHAEVASQSPHNPPLRHQAHQMTFLIYLLSNAAQPTLSKSGQ